MKSKLLGAAMVYINGVLVGGGPGHHEPDASQVIRELDVLPFLRLDGQRNVVGFSCFFDHSQATKGQTARVQAVLQITDSQVMLLILISYRHPSPSPSF